jgi:hypothetical protein
MNTSEFDGITELTELTEFFYEGKDRQSNCADQGVPQWSLGTRKKRKIIQPLSHP